MNRTNPEDDPAHNILPRPEAEASHDRFFDDGEEPPARYDLPDPIDYIEVNPEPIESARWRRLGKVVAWENGSYASYYVTNYYLASLLTGWCACLIVPFQAFGAPILHSMITGQALRRLTGDKKVFLTTRSFQEWFGIEICSCPVFVIRVIALYGIFLIGAAVAEMVEILDRWIVDRRFVLMSDWFTYPLAILGGAFLILVHTLVVVRAFGFTTQLILDYKLDPIQSIRANWRITRGRTWQLVRLKFRLWFWKYLAGLLTFGLGLLLYEPYSCAVWTAAYLDIAGSEPPREFDEPSTPSSPATPT